MTWEGALAFGPSLPGTEFSTRYGKAAGKIASSGRAFPSPSCEVETSFAVGLNLGAIELLQATEPETCWQSARDEGSLTVLVRQESKNDERMREVILRLRDRTAGLPRARPRARR